MGLWKEELLRELGTGSGHCMWPGGLWSLDKKVCAGGAQDCGGMEGTLELGTHSALGVGGGAGKRGEWLQGERGREGISSLGWLPVMGTA